jgi:hypothetical protein
MSTKEQMNKRRKGKNIGQKNKGCRSEANGVEKRQNAFDQCAAKK